MWRRRAFSTAIGASSSASDLPAKKWDALVIGGGHNGLVASSYLARAGLSVAVLERRHVIGGAAVTEELVPGFRFTRCSYLYGLLRPTVFRELELARHGLKLLKPWASSFTPCLDGRSLLLGIDHERDHSEISKFSKRDADAYPSYENQLNKFRKLVDFILDSRTPENFPWDSSYYDGLQNNWQKLAFWASCLQHAFSLGQKDMVEFMDLLLSPTSKFLNKLFEVIIYLKSLYEILQ